MITFKQIREAFQTKASNRAVVFFSNVGSIFVPGVTRDYTQLADEGYQQCTEVFACINLIARASGGVKWLVYQKQKKGKKLVEIEDMNHPLVKLIIRPNPYQSWGKFIENLTGYYYVAGNGYVHRVGPGATKPPKELWLLRPDRVQVIPSKNPAAGPIARYDYKVKDESKIVPLGPDRNIDMTPWQVVKHFKTFNPLDDLYGLSPIRASARVVDQMNEAAVLNFKLLKNGARPSGAFVVKGAIDEKLEAELKKQLEEQYGGSGNAGKQLLLTGDMDWKQMGMTQKDMDWIEGQKMNSRRICSTMGVAPELIGDVQNKTYNNQKEARKALFVETVMPHLDNIQDELNAWLTPMFGDNIQIGYDKDDIDVIKDERTELWGRVLQAVDSSVITPNEGRFALGYEADLDPASDKLRPVQVKTPTRYPMADPAPGA